MSSTNRMPPHVDKPLLPDRPMKDPNGWSRTPTLSMPDPLPLRTPASETMSSSWVKVTLYRSPYLAAAPLFRFRFSASDVGRTGASLPLQRTPSSAFRAAGGAPVTPAVEGSTRFGS